MHIDFNKYLELLPNLDRKINKNSFFLEKYFSVKLCTYALHRNDICQNLAFKSLLSVVLDVMFVNGAVVHLVAKQF